MSLPKAQKSNPETLQLQQDVVNSRVCVAGQQHTEPTGVKDANLMKQRGARRDGGGWFRVGEVDSRVRRVTGHDSEFTREQMVVVFPVPGMPTITV